MAKRDKKSPVENPFVKIVESASPLTESKNMPKTPNEELVQTPEEIARDEAIKKRAREIFEARKIADPKGTEKETEPSNDDYVAATNEVVNRGGAKDPGVDASQPLVPPIGAPGSAPEAAPDSPGPEVVPTMPPTGAPEASSASIDLEQERKNREEFEQVKKEFDENERKIAEARHKSKGKLKIIFEALGIWKRNVEDEEIKGYLENRKTLHPKLMAAGRQVLSGDEQKWKEFETNYHETMIAIKSRLEEDGIRAEEAKFSNVFVGLANVSKNYRGFISKQFLKDGKITVTGVAKGLATAAAIGFVATTLIASSLPALGIVAVGSAGATVGGATWRAFGSIGAGYALKKRMEMGFVEEKEKEVQADVLKIIEAKKQKTDEEWNAFIAEREGLKSITGEEQAFANADAKHKRLALGLAGGTFVAGTIASYYAADIKAFAKGLFGQAWDKVTHLFGGGNTGFYDAHGPIAITEVPKGPSHVPETAGKGAVIPEQIRKPFLGDTQIIDKKENNCVWKATRNLYLKHHGEYDYDPNNPKTNLKLRKLFVSLKDQGFLRRMGIKAHNFDSLSDHDKMKIWAENRTANSAEWYKHHHGGKIPTIVHEHDMVTLDNKGRMFFGDTSNIKAGYSHDVSSTHGAGRSAAESYAGRGGGAGQAVAEASAPGGAGRAAAETYNVRGGAASEPTNFRPTRSPGELAAQAKLDQNQWIKENILHPEYGKAAALEGSMMDMNINYKAINLIAKEALGNPFLPSEKMSDIAEVIKFHVPGVFPEGSETLTYAEQQARTKGVQFLQSLIEKFPYNPGESYRDYLSKIPLEQIHYLRKQFNL